MNREEWLLKAGVELANTVLKNQTIPKYRVSCGLPSKGAFSLKQQVLGQCWGDKSSNDKHYEVFVSPVLADPVKVLDTLVHEMVHVIVGVEGGHGPKFKKLARAIGLEGPVKSTVAGPDLSVCLRDIATKLGPYPHGALVHIGSVKSAKRTTVKLLCKCGYLLRTSKKWTDLGLPTCRCGKKFEIDESE